VAKRPKRWFGVKSLLRIQVIGEPIGTDEVYAPGNDLIEERVVIVRARSHKAAFRKAGREARRYRRGWTHINPYGQLVAARRVRQLASFVMFRRPAELREVWSATRVVPSTTADSELTERLFGPEETSEALDRRKIFVSGMFSGKVEAESKPTQ
jgi:hypothetical protein